MEVYDLIFKNNNYNKILIVIDGKFLGDFIHKLLPLVISTKIYKPSSIVYVYTLNLTETLDKIAKLFSNFFVLFNSNFDITFDLVYKFEKWDKRIKNLNFKELYLSNNDCTFFNWHHIFDFIPFLHKDTIDVLQKTCKVEFYKFFNEPNKFNILKKDIVINIGAGTQNKNCNNNLLFQNRIAQVIDNLPNKKIILIGFTRELVSKNLENCLNFPNVINLLDKQKCIYELIDILFNCNYLIVRNTGVMHLAGLCKTKNIITFNANNKPLDRLSNFLRWRPNILIDKKLYFKERWSPMITNIISIIEYKPFNYCYNNNIPIEVVRLINEIN